MAERNYFFYPAIGLLIFSLQTCATLKQLNEKERKPQTPQSKKQTPDSKKHWVYGPFGIHTLQRLLKGLR